MEMFYKLFIFTFFMRDFSNGSGNENGKNHLSENLQTLFQQYQLELHNIIENNRTIPFKADTGDLRLLAICNEICNHYLQHNVPEVKLYLFKPHVVSERIMLNWDSKEIFHDVPGVLHCDAGVFSKWLIYADNNCYYVLRERHDFSREKLFLELQYSNGRYCPEAIN